MPEAIFRYSMNILLNGSDSSVFFSIVNSDASNIEFDEYLAYNISASDINHKVVGAIENLNWLFYKSRINV